MRKWLPILFLVSLLLLSGCWSRREINDLGAVVSLGLDRTEEGLLDVTLSVVQPGAAGSGKGQQQVQGRRSRIILHRQAGTITEALRLADLASPRRLALDHTQVILLGERFAVEGTDALLDFLLRSPQLRLSARVFMVKGATPLELLENEPLMRSTQAEALRELEASRAGLVISLKEFFIARTSPHMSPMVTVLRLFPHRTREVGAPEQEVQLAGATIFKGDAEGLELDRAGVRGLLWLRGDVRDAVITAPCPQVPDKLLSARVSRASRQLIPQWNGRQLRYAVTIRTEMRITEMQCLFSLETPEQVTSLEGAMVREIEHRVGDVVRQLQATGTDPIGFGERVRARLPQAWAQIGGSERWLSYWPSVPVDVDVKVNVLHLNMTNEPPRIKRPADR